MKNLKDFKFNETLQEMQFYTIAENYESFSEYTSEMQDDNDKLEEQIANVGVNIHFSESKRKTEEEVKECIKLMKEWFRIRSLFSSTVVEVEEFVDLSLLLVDKNCKMWIDGDDEGNVGFYIDRNVGEFVEREYSEEKFESDIVKHYTYRELSDGVEIDGVGFNVYVGESVIEKNDSGEDYAYSLVFRKI